MFASIELFRFDRYVQVSRMAGLTREARRGQSKVPRASNPRQFFGHTWLAESRTAKRVAWLVECDLPKFATVVMSHTNRPGKPASVAIVVARSRILRLHPTWHITDRTFGLRC